MKLIFAIIALFTLPLFAQLAITNPFFPAAVLKPAAAGGGGSPSWILVRSNQFDFSAVTGVSAAQAHTAGNLIVVMTWTVFGNAPVTTITNTALDTWAVCTGSQSGTDDVLSIWYAVTAGHAADKIGVTLSSSKPAGVLIFEYSGQAASSPFETAASGSATGTSVTSGSFSPAATGNLNVVSGAVYDGPAGAWTPATDYVNVLNVTSYNTQGGHRTNSTPSGAQTASYTFATSQPLRIAVASFKPQ